MKLNKVIAIVFGLSFGLGTNSFAQDIKKDNASKGTTKLDSYYHLLSKNVKTDTLVINIDDGILKMKQVLTEGYLQSDRSKQDHLNPSEKKRILNVGWFDSDFNKFETTHLGELISIGVLTEGYEIGEKVEVTIDGGDDSEESLISGIICNEITFIGYVTSENFAFFEGLFTVEGAKEHLNIAPEWKDRYICK